MLPLISIIVPVYNVEEHLKKCIESLLNQTYSNLEIILIDDGSTDKSGKICDKYSNKYVEIYTYHKKNSGSGLTRNYGMNKARGKYITFVDSDDYVDKDLIRALVTPILKNEKIDTVIGGFTKIDNSGRILFKEVYEKELFLGDSVKKKLLPRTIGSLPNIKDSIKPTVWNCLYSMDIIKKNNLQFVSERKVISEDVEWNSHYFLYASKVMIINSALYFYRLNLSSLTKKYDPNRFNKYVDFYNYMEQRLKDINLISYTKLRLQKNFFISLRVSLEQLNVLPIRKQYKEIKKICNNNVVKRIIGEYPINKLSFKQRVFIEFVKNNNVFFLILANKLGLK